jgi:hypothetical protein
MVEARIASTTKMIPKSFFLSMDGAVSGVGESSICGGGKFSICISL